jgi:Flp pilus assembly protein TadD
MGVLGWIIAGLAAIGAALAAMLLIARRRLPAAGHDALVRAMTHRLSQNPRDVAALQALADVSWRDGAWQDTAERYGRLLKLVGVEPGVDEFTAILRRGASAWRLGRLEDARLDLVLARAKDGQSFEAAYYLGCLEEARGAHGDAVTHLSAACALDPEHGDAVRMLGLSLARAKRSGAALPVLQRAAELFPDDVEVGFTLGQVLHAEGRSGEALACFSRLRTDAGLGPAAALFAGTIRLNGRQTERAVADFEFGLRHPSVKREIRLELQYRLAAALMGAHDVSRAVSVWQEIEAVDPAYRDTVALLGRYREMSGNRKLQVYLLAPTADFVSLCRRLATTYHRPATTKLASISLRQAEYVDITALVTTRTWTDTVLMRFLRTPGVIGELLLRDLHAKARETKAGRCVCVCPGTYTEAARAFVEGRMIEIADGKGLGRLLERVTDVS